jgi:hypothetical protein
VITAHFSAGYAEMITRISLDRRDLYPLLLNDEVGYIPFEAAVDTDDVPQARAAVW